MPRPPRDVVVPWKVQANIGEEFVQPSLFELLRCFLGCCTCRSDARVAKDRCPQRAKGDVEMGGQRLLVRKVSKVAGAVDDRNTPE
jgi:hypothetical protein